METLAWAAGLFEGQGAVSLVGRQRLSLRSPREDSVRRFGAAVGCGKVYGPYGPYAARQSPYWIWVAEGADVQTAKEKLELHLSGWVVEKLELITKGEDR